MLKNNSKSDLELFLKFYRKYLLQYEYYCCFIISLNFSTPKRLKDYGITSQRKPMQSKTLFPSQADTIIIVGRDSESRPCSYTLSIFATPLHTPAMDLEWYHCIITVSSIFYIY